MLESRDGSENLDEQVIYGTQYVDEIVRVEKQDQGTMFVHQDANWNVTSSTNYAGTVLDRLYLTSYGQPTIPELIREPMRSAAILTAAAVRKWTSYHFLTGL